MSSEESGDLQKIHSSLLDILIRFSSFLITKIRCNNLKENCLSLLSAERWGTFLNKFFHLLSISEHRVAQDFMAIGVTSAFLEKVESIWFVESICPWIKVKYIRIIKFVAFHLRFAGIPHSTNYEETGTSEGLWDRLGRLKMTNFSFFDVFKAPSFALVNFASQSNATGFENVENDVMVCHLRSTQTIPQSFTSTNLLVVYGVGNWCKDLKIQSTLS